MAPRDRRHARWQCQKPARPYERLESRIHGCVLQFIADLGQAAAVEVGDAAA